MPDAGRANHDKYRIALPKPRPEFPALPWKCEGTTMLNVYFEVRKEVLLDWLPSEFCRSTPAYCRLAIFEHRDSPIGPYRDAFLALGCRLSMMPAGFAAASMTDNPKALAAGVFDRGYPATLGKIDLTADVSRAHALLSDEKGPLLEVTMPLLQTIEPSRLAYDHVDALVTRDDGSIELLVTSPDLKIERAAICKSTRIDYPAERASAWSALNCRNVVSSQVVHGIRTFAAAHKPGQGA